MRSWFQGRKAWLLPLAWASLIFLLSSLPGDATPQLGFRFGDKMMHVLAYMPLGFGLLFAISRHPGPFGAQPAFWAQALGALYGISDEVHQYFVPTRCMDLGDMAADALGVFLGVFVCLLLIPESGRKRGKSNG